jgi:hypothetical protein
VSLPFSADEASLLAAVLLVDAEADVLEGERVMHSDVLIVLPGDYHR